MALSNCPECKKEISSKARTCPHCGYAPKKSSGCTSVVLFVIGLFIVMAIVGGLSDSNESTSFTPTKLDALRHAESKIKPLLKSPSTAEFPSYSERYKNVTGCCGEFKINSWVDSQNGFGATIRTNYSCTVYYIDDKLGVKDLNIQD